MIVRERPHGAHLFFIIRGSVLPHIAWELATCTLLAIAVTITHGFILQWKVTLTPVPFSLIGLANNHLPLDALCRVIEVNLLEALGETELPPFLEPVGLKLT